MSTRTPLPPTDGCVYWFRRDLRLADNPAFTAFLTAARAPRAPGSNPRVVALYIEDRTAAGPSAPGAAARWYLHHSLRDLQRRLAALGIALVTRVGETTQQLLAVCREYSATAVYCNRIPEPHWAGVEAQLATTCKAAGVQFHAWYDGTLFAPDSVRKPDGGRYRVFTPFARQSRAQLANIHATALLRDPPAPIAPAIEADPHTIDALRLLDAHPWHPKLHAHWQPGETAATHQLEQFCAQTLSTYATTREQPAIAGTSRLSAPLHWGEISIWRVLSAVQAAPIAPDNEPSRERFITELLWREFGYHLLAAAPDSVSRSLYGGYEPLWHHDADALTRWQQGQTGIALVDAGMRELWETGWMHNRVRMVVASFLSKNLGLHWRDGAAWFWDTLVDADLASNTMGWQWVAGCGVDAAPYFRIFNPDTQAERFDPAGEYIRRWLGDRRRPPPMLDLKQSRAAALLRYQNLPARHGLQRQE